VSLPMEEEEQESRYFGLQFIPTSGRQRRTSMVDWFETLAARSELSADAASELHHRGYIVLPGPVPPEPWSG
jgi:hypothetical protein